MKAPSTVATGLCPEPRDFFRHENNPKDAEKGKAGVHHLGSFGLLSEYSLDGCVPALPSSAFPDDKRYTTVDKMSSRYMKIIRGLPSAVTRFKLTTTNNELEAQCSQEASHE